MSNKYDSSSLSYQDKIAVEEHERLSPRLIYEIIRRNGLKELSRPKTSLIFSGVAAGIIITLSFIFKAVFNAYLPNTIWAPIIANLGYSIGFILVILGHMQLFTENTITTVVPLFNQPTLKTTIAMIRLWTIVLCSNLIGTALAAWFLQNSQVLDPIFVDKLNEISQHVVTFGAWENMWRGIPSGLLIAALVWVLPTSKNYAFFLVLLITYLIALGDFTHVVVGSAEILYWVMQQQASLYDYFIRFLLPTGLGNIIGGTFIFTLLIHAQIREEIRHNQIS